MVLLLRANLHLSRQLNFSCQLDPVLHQLDNTERELLVNCCTNIYKLFLTRNNFSSSSLFRAWRVAFVSLRERIVICSSDLSRNRLLEWQK